MFCCLWVYGCSYSEYNLYGFSKLKHRDRREFIGDCCRKKYYMMFNSVMKVSAAEADSVQECFDQLRSLAPDEEIIIEEYVHQASELKALHPSSLNTARIITVVDRTGIPHIIGTLFRIGKDGNVVDNGASGGILCALSEDGTIQKSMDKKNNRFYIQHPNTGHPLVGFTIPRWSEAIALALELALKKPGIRYCGWDLALTDNGWVMIEGNEGAELAGIQIFGGGCKPSIERYLS